jgi:hypothetical protein
MNTWRGAKIMGGISFAKSLSLAGAIALWAAPPLYAQGTLTTPTTPTIPAGRPVGQSTIISPGMSAPLTNTTGIPGSGRPCSASTPGSIPGNAGLGTMPGGTSTQSGGPIIMSGPGAPAPGTQSAGSISGINPSVTPGVGGSC